MYKRNSKRRGDRIKRHELRIECSMTKKQIIIALVTFIIGFGGTFLLIRTYFPKQKVEKKLKSITLVATQLNKTSLLLNKF
jgi:hypothetical protein